MRFKYWTATELNRLAKRIHRQHRNWWIDLDTGRLKRRNKGELLMLTITELAEAVEGVRRGLMDDKLPHRMMEEVELADAAIRLFDYAGGYGIPLATPPPFARYFAEHDNKAERLLGLAGSVWEAYRHSFGEMDFQVLYLSQCFAAIQTYCFDFGLDLRGAMEEKLKYNKTRKDHKLEQRKKDGGKKF
jgi:hypothetical protein